eukprot:TCALIF_04864-PA protein Name:"Protein of unknown function" AED:0.30 eAED:0.51 QI:11/0/0/1/0/0/3/0/145
MEANNQIFSMAEEGLIRQSQLEAFNADIEALKSGKSISKSSRLLQLSPFLDKAGIIRAKVRIVDYNQKHPIVMCPKVPLTTLIVKQYHMNNHHPGTNHLLGLLQQKLPVAIYENPNFELSFAQSWVFLTLVHCAMWVPFPMMLKC